MAKVFTITEGLENMGALKSGGQGSVYKGRRIGEIITAIKLLPTPIHSESQDDKHFIAFQNEVNKLKKVNIQPNPNVVKILSSGITESGSLPYIEMEYVEGPDLEDLLKPPHDPVFTIKEVIKLADQLANALAHCHKVDVKHGDIKTNNVKFNVHTGNYVLLDFGLAIMSDEQRRTSLRHAGAIEFMAPEQNEGHMLFETDVYSFGIVLFELLAGVVPFPLKEGGETARNSVMLGHMETPPPDILLLRRQALPESWNADKKDREMEVPQWLLSLVYKCLEKKPFNRFANGIRLQEYILNHGHRPQETLGAASPEVPALQKQIEDLKREKAALQHQLEEARWKQSATTTAAEPLPSRPPEAKPPGKGFPQWIYFLLLLAGLSAVVYALIRNRSKETAGPDQTEARTEVPKRVIGQYKVQSPKAYFHNEPDPATRRTAYMIPSNDVITATDERDGFVYTEFTNSRGQTSKGWVRRSDLVTLEEWTQQARTEAAQPKPAQEDINLQLAEARKLLQNNDNNEALYI
ncbi:MAG TPA: serine/threonine-protein kinase, partial [Flavisolibacter sp.]